MRLAPLVSISLSAILGGLCFAALDLRGAAPYGAVGGALCVGAVAYWLYRCESGLVGDALDRVRCASSWLFAFAILLPFFTWTYYREVAYLARLGGRAMTPWEAVFQDGWGEAYELRALRMEEMELGALERGLSKK